VACVPDQPTAPTASPSPRAAVVSIAGLPKRSVAPI
jgi:hypothetical protein